jgi:CRISPR-associated exonuclease Cas4
VELTKELREKVAGMLLEMHEYQKRGYTPKVKPGPHCRACSLREVCLPVLCKNPSARAYLQKALETEAL